MQRSGEGPAHNDKYSQLARAYIAEVRPDLILIEYGFSTGQPEKEDISWLAGNDWFGAKCVGLNQYMGRKPDGSVLIDEWNALRHRKVHEWTDGNHPEFVIVECGGDYIDTQPSGPWTKLRVSYEQQAKDLVAFEAEIAKDDYLLGATGYATGPMGDQEIYSLDDVVPFLLPYYKNNEEETPMTNKYEYRYGFAEKASELGREVVGEPKYQENYDEYGNSWQHTTKGLMFWHKAANKVYFFEAK